MRTPERSRMTPLALSLYDYGLLRHPRVPGKFQLDADKSHRPFGSFRLHYGLVSLGPKADRLSIQGLATVALVALDFDLKQIAALYQDLARKFDPDARITHAHVESHSSQVRRRLDKTKTGAPTFSLAIAQGVMSITRPSPLKTLANLTTREKDIISRLSLGESTAAISTGYGVSGQAIRKNIAALCDRAGVAGARGLLAAAVMEHVVDTDELLPLLYPGQEPHLSRHTSVVVPS